MEDQDTSAEGLTASLEVLPEWDRLWVRDFWDAVIAAELGARQSPASPYSWPERPVLRLIKDADAERFPEIEVIDAINNGPRQYQKNGIAGDHHGGIQL